MCNTLKQRLLRRYLKVPLATKFAKSMPSYSLCKQCSYGRTVCFARQNNRSIDSERYLLPFRQKNFKLTTRKFDHICCKWVGICRLSSSYIWLRRRTGRPCGNFRRLNPITVHHRTQYYIIIKFL